MSTYWGSIVLGHDNKNDMYTRSRVHRTNQQNWKAGEGGRGALETKSKKRTRELFTNTWYNLRTSDGLMMVIRGEYCDLNDTGRDGKYAETDLEESAFGRATRETSTTMTIMNVPSRKVGDRL